MAPSQGAQLENVIDEVIKSGHIQALDVFLERDTHEKTVMKCSQQFLNKLDKLISRSLDQKDARSAGLGFASLYKCGTNLKLPGGGQGLSALITQGLIKKISVFLYQHFVFQGFKRKLTLALIESCFFVHMVQWFEKCRQIWTQHGPHWDETLFTLSENFLNALMAVHETCKEGTYKITESFLYPVGRLVVDPRIYILIQKEAVRKYNLILDKIPVEFKKNRKILASQEASDIMAKLAGRILEGGDYDLQSSLMEALCRMAPPDQRRKLADRWFTMGHVACAFAQISDSEFETACRRFLNMVNGMQGDKRRVNSYPCLEVYLGNYELLMPSDEKLEEFWIDFNLSSRSISFYFSLPEEEDGHWETICINENEVQSYTVTEEGERRVLRIKLSEVVVVGAVEGSILTIHFSSSLEILQAARNVYGLSKNKVHSLCTSVGKGAAKIVTEGNSTQVVPESQVSLGVSEQNTAPYILSATAASAQMVTPAKMKMSESITFFCSSGGRILHSGSSVGSKLSARDKDKPPLERVCSRDTAVKTCSHITTLGSTNAVGMKEQKTPVAEAVDVVVAGQGEEKSLENYFVPDTQPTSGRNTSSCWHKFSVTEMLMMPTQKISSLPRSEPRSSLAREQERCPPSAQKLSVSDSNLVIQKQLHKELTQRLQQVVSERNHDPPPQRPTAFQNKTSNTRRDSKDRSSENQRDSSWCTPKGQQAQRNDHTKGTSKGKMSFEAEAVPTKSSVRATATKTAPKRIPPKVKDEIKTVPPNKEKRDTEVAGSMVKLISGRYEMKSKSSGKETVENIAHNWLPPIINKPLFNMSWLSSKREMSGAVSLIKSLNKSTKTSVRQRKDIFAFDIDSPLSIEGENKTFTKTPATLSSNGIHNSVCSSTTKKSQPVAKNKRYVKRHLFSDTDTDNATTEASWLRESSRKSKPKVTKYSRRALIKPKVATFSLCRSLKPHSGSRSVIHHIKAGIRPSVLFRLQMNPQISFHPLQKLIPLSHSVSLLHKKKPYLKKALDQPKKAVDKLQTVKSAAAAPHAAGKRPKRAVATSAKSYRDPDTDDSQSEAERHSAPKANNFCISYVIFFLSHSENSVKTRDAAQTKKKKPASKQPSRMYLKQQPEFVAEMPPTSKTYSVGQQGKSEKTRSDAPQVKKRKNTLSDQCADDYRKKDGNSWSDLKKHSGLKLRPGNVLQETSKLNKENMVPAQEQTGALKNSLAACQSSFCPSPPFIEKMRAAEGSAPTLALTRSIVLTPLVSPLPTSPRPPCKDTPSPIPLLPKLRSAVSSKGKCKPSSFYSSEKNHGSAKTLSIPSAPSPCSLGGESPATSPPAQPTAAEMCAVQQHLLSAPQSPLTLSSRPLLTSTLLELDSARVTSSPQSTFPEDTISHGCHLDFSKVSTGSFVSLSQSSTKSSVLSKRIKARSTAALSVSLKSEKTPLSDRELELTETLISGPNHKRHNSSSSDSEEEEKKKSKIRGQRSPRMKPRKLFKSFAEVSAVGGLSCVVSSSHVSSSHCESEGMDRYVDEDLELTETDGNPSDLCQQLSSELKNKFQNHCKMLEIYNKQSSKTVQQHISSISVQLTKYRTQRLEQVEKVLLEEINKMEQDDNVLKSMEKDLTMCWKKQTMAFHSYHNRETKRNETFRRALQSSACHSLEYEEGIFTSEMGLIRKDMKSVQDRLLNEMQEGEIQSVKRGLRALFFP
ncbi:uncharacterized protein sycp2 [Odontesthes bonariensis]|uniref:uncharacterized protein sycp2 n=1 Tax=Odontesthes bonariensis TaxID=219752 RepID=UPI003F58FB0B